MKKLSKVLLLILTLALVFSFAACGDKDTDGGSGGSGVGGESSDAVSAISISGTDFADGKISTTQIIGIFRLSAYNLTYVKENGESDSIAISEDMLSAEDKAKLSTEGTLSITVNYGGKNL